jgi:hypothetical protein
MNPLFAFFHQRRVVEKLDWWSKPRFGGNHHSFLPDNTVPPGGNCFANRERA